MATNFEIRARAAMRVAVLLGGWEKYFPPTVAYVGFADVFIVLVEALRVAALINSRRRCSTRWSDRARAAMRVAVRFGGGKNIFRLPSAMWVLLTYFLCFRMLAHW